MKLIGLTLALALLLAACGGGDISDPDPVLQLPTGDITETDFRLQARASLMEVPFGTPRVCSGMADLNDEDAAKLIIVLQSPRLGPGTPYFEAISDDQRRAAAIFKEECAHIQ